jgi:ferredoxin-NADP reductase
MGVYTVKLLKHHQVAEGTMAFYFARPSGFDFAAGQTIDVTLIDPPETDAKGNTRTFSLASAPHEPHLMVTTRLRDTAFKRTLRTFQPGTEVKIEGPFGSFTLQRKTTRAAVMLTGGIGITPFRSMIVQATKANTGHTLFLFYSNHRPEDAAFLDELGELARRHTNLTLVATMTNLTKSHAPWSGEKEHISVEMLMKYVTDLADPIYYIAGPPGMVAAMKEMLNEAGVDEDDVKSEDFAGY